MKRYIITLLLMTSFTGIALANNNNNKADKKATAAVVTPAESNAVVSVKQLQDENNFLKQQLLALYNENEELKGVLSFQQTMTNLFSTLTQQKLNDQLEEMNAQIGYNNMMANMLLKLKQSGK